MYQYETGQPEQEMQAPPADSPEMGEAPPADASQGDQEAQLQELAASAPEPSKPFSVKSIESLVKTFNDTLKKISNQEMPEISLDLGSESKWDQPLPGDIFLPLLAIAELLNMLSGGEFADKYNFDLFNVTDDTGLRKVEAMLKMMAKDKKFIAAVKELQEGAPAEGGAPPEGEMAPAPDAMPEEDEMLAAEMQ
jgi:hypothetical protein|tara:strand:- start:510 stop:1091 length:582 start_codon:yes stop_codon:yes gene_type:complete